jgi:hypothetical protein
MLRPRALAVVSVLLAVRSAAAFVTLSPNATIEAAARWSAVPHAATGFAGLHDGIQVAVEPGLAEELVLAVTGSVAADQVALAERAVAAAFHAWESPVLRFDVVFDGPAVEGTEAGAEIDVFAVPDAHPAFASNSFFGVTFTSAVVVADRLLTNGVTLEGAAIRGSDIFLNLDMLAAIAPIFTLEQRPAALQRLLMHEIGHALGLQYPNEFASRNRDTDADPLNVVAIDPASPFAGLLLSANVDRNAIMSNLPSDLPGALVFTALRNDDRGGRDVLYPALACPPAPRPGCRTAGASSLTVKDVADDADDEVTWTWSEGQAVAVADLGDPLATTGWTLCVYDGAPESLVLAAVAPAGAPAWTFTSKKGFKYARKDLLPNGVRTLALKPGADGKAKARLTAKGVPLAPPAPPLALPVTVQLGSRDVPLCLAASFDAGSVKRNEAGKLKAKSSSS